MNEEQISEQTRELTAGEILRNERTMGRRKRELSTIAKQLCISEEFLEALETGNYKKIPEIVYILGFARNYAMELGLNPDEIVAKIKKELGIEQETETPITTEELEERNHAAEYKAKVREVFMGIMRFIGKHWIWAAVITGVIVIAIVLMVLFSPVSDDEAFSNSDQVIEQQQDVMQEPVYNFPVREHFGKENLGKSSVIIQAIEDSYIGVEDYKGRVIFGRSLVAGDVYYVPAGSGYKARFGNAGGVDVWVNGELAPKVGPNKTSKKDVSLDPDALMQKVLK